MRPGTQEKVDEVKRLIETGMKLGEALKQTNTSHNTWYQYRKRRGPRKWKAAKPTKPFMQEIPVVESTRNKKLICVIGDTHTQ